MIDSGNKVQDSLLAQLAISARQGERKDRLGQDAFMQLMVAQLNNQDPLNPLQSGEFLTQIAQFGTVSGIGELRDSFAGLAASMQSSQALQASTMVGRNVLVAGNEVTTDEPGAGARGAVELERPTGSLSVLIHDASGQLVRRLELGAHEAGVARFTWDGLGEAGEPLPPGVYRLSAEAAGADGVTAAGTLVEARVESVTLPSGGRAPQLNVARIGPVELGAVREVL